MVIMPPGGRWSLIGLLLLCAASATRGARPLHEDAPVGVLLAHHEANASASAAASRTAGASKPQPKHETHGAAGGDTGALLTLRTNTSSRASQRQQSPPPSQPSELADLVAPSEVPLELQLEGARRVTHAGTDWSKRHIADGGIKDVYYDPDQRLLLDPVGNYERFMKPFHTESFAEKKTPTAVLMGDLCHDSNNPKCFDSRRKRRIFSSSEHASKFVNQLARIVVLRTDMSERWARVLRVWLDHLEQRGDQLRVKLLEDGTLYDRNRMLFQKLEGLDDEAGARGHASFGLHDEHIRQLHRDEVH